MKKGNPYISIYNPDGTEFLSIIVTKDAKRKETLMTEDYIELSWVSNKRFIIPVGAYVFDSNGEKLSLYDPYEPEQLDEVQFKYTPQFQSCIIGEWGKTPLFFYNFGTDGGTISSREPEWDITDNAKNILDLIARAIEFETGQKWNTAIALDLGGYKTLSFRNTNIISGLNALADEWETEWYVDKSAKTLYLGKALIGDPKKVTLKVGENINTPSITINKEGYFNRFFVFGSNRNITQEYKGANVNNLVNKRLTLDPVKYPYGYIDKRASYLEPVLAKTLIFDEIYPKSSLLVAEARPRLMYTLNQDSGAEGSKVQVGTDADGNPIYDTYTIWYIQLKDALTGKPYRLANNDFFSKDCPEGVRIQGKNISIHFSSGSLLGREFELEYHTKDETLTDSDGIPFNVKEGDFEIFYTKDGDYIIPAQTGLIPSDGDSVILFNLRMPEEYIESAYKELEEAADKEIQQYFNDRNNYEFSSNPVAFNNTEELLNLKIGQAITYQNEEYSYETRIISIEKNLDFPCQQVIGIGNEKIKGTRQTLEENVADANKDINLIAAFNQIAQNAIDSYNRAIQQMTEGFARISNIWKFDPEIENTIYSDFNVYSKGSVSALGFNGGGNGDTGHGSTGGKSYLADLLDVQLGSLQNGQALVWNGSKWINQTISSGSGGLNESELGKYLSEKGYATQTWVQNQGYLKSVSWGEISNKPSWIGPEKPSYAFGELISHPTTLSGYGITDALSVDQANGLFVKKIGDTMSGTLIFRTNKPLQFNHAYPYIINPNGGFYFVAGTDNIPNTNVCILRMTPGDTNIIDSPIGADLGRSMVRWNNIFSVLGNFSTSITIGKATISWDEENQGLKIDTGLYSEKWVSVNGVNTGTGGSGTTGKSHLSDLLDVSLSGLTSGQYLMWNGSKWVNKTIQSTSGDFVSDLGISGNYLTWTKNGKINNITVPFATNADTLDSLHASSFMRFLGTGIHSDNENLYHGCGYTFSTGNISSYNGPFIGFGTATYFKVLWGRYGVNNLYLRTYSDGEWIESREFAFLDSNVASATNATYANQLLNAKNIWGQSFNGLSDVSGTLSNVTDINLNGHIKGSNSYMYFDNVTGGSISFRIEGFTNTLDATLRIRKGRILDGGTNNGTLLGDTVCRWKNIYSVLGNFSGEVTMASTLNVSGLITAQSGIKIGDATIIYDYANEGLKITHGLYSEKWISVNGLNNGMGSGGTVSGDFLPLTGGTLTGGITFDISSAGAQLAFSRNSYNYIHAKTAGGSLAFVMDGKSISIANASLAIGSNGIFPGESGSYSLGLSGQRWSTLYANTVNVTSTSVVSNLNADMLDGYHSSDFITTGVLSNYLPLSGGTLTGVLHANTQISLGGSGVNYINARTTGGSIAFVANGKSITAVPAGLNATLIIESAYLRPGQTNVFDIGSATYQWKTIYTNEANLSGALTFNISSATAQMKFTRGSLNYIHASESGGSLAFVVNGLTISQANSALRINADGISPGASGTFNCGSTNFRWNGIYGVTGNFSSAVSQNTSDLRLKTDINSVSCLEILEKIGNPFSFRYTSEAVGDRHWLDTTTIHYGFAYQNAIRAHIPGFTGTDEKGYGWINFLSSDMLALMAGGIIELSIRQRSIENDMNNLRQRINTLESENRELKERIAQLEEA